jgi:hypothetical protein
MGNAALSNRRLPASATTPRTSGHGISDVRSLQRAQEPAAGVPDLVTFAMRDEHQAARDQLVAAAFGERARSAFENEQPLIRGSR